MHRSLFLLMLLMLLLQCTTFFVVLAAAEEDRPEATVAAATAATESMNKPIDLNTNDYQSKVMESRDFWLVGYKDSSKEMPSVFDKGGLDPFASKLSNYGFGVGVVDCAIDKKACKFVQKLPSFQMFVDVPQKNPYTAKLFRQPLQFEGNFKHVELRDFERSVAQLFPSTLVTKIESVEQFNALLKEKNKLPTAVLFSTKSTISLVYRSIAYSLKDRMNVVFSSVKSPLALSYGVSDSKLGVLDVDGGSAKWYDGSDMNSRKELAAWLTTHAKEEQLPDGSNDDDVLEANDVGQTLFNASTLQLDAMSMDEAWLVAVVDGKDKRPDNWAAAIKGCVGRIKCAVLVCDDDSVTSSAAPDGSNSGVDATTVSFGQKTCQGLQGMLPRYLAVRHGAPARKKLRETGTDKWGSSVLSEVTDHKKVQKFLGESLPETAVTPVTEYNIWQFVTAGTMLGKVSIVLVSNSDQVPGLYRNLALSLGEQAQYGFMSMPSPDFTKAIGGKLPAIIAIPSPASSDEAEKKGVQIVNYNPELLGPFNYAGLSQFVQGVYSAFEHTFSEAHSEQSKKAAPKIEQEEPTPVVDEGPIIADSEESKDEAEAFLREIQLEEEARAARLKEEEMKEEEEKRKAEEGSKKKKKKKGKKGKKSKGKEEL